MGKNKVSIKVSPEFRDAVNLAAKTNPDLKYTYKVCDKLIPMIPIQKLERVADFEKIQKKKKPLFEF
jgi:hypothetical protein